MNEQLQQALSELILKTTSGVEQSTAFILAEMPEVIQQLLLWELTLGILSFVITPIVAVLCGYSCFKIIESDSSNDLLEPLFMICMIGFVGSSFLFLTLGIPGIVTAIQIWIAPKVFLLEYASSLIK